MFIQNDDLSIYCTRGDCGDFTVKAVIDGKPSVFAPGDVLRFKMFKKKDCSAVVMQRDFAVEAESDTFVISLTDEDTKIGEIISKPVDYWYEVELNPETHPQTIIGYDEDGPKVFKLFPEGKDVDAEDIEAVGPKTLKELVDYTLEQAKESGDFKGEKGDKGDKGDPGSGTDIGLDKGSAEGSVQTAQSKALSPYSFAFGTQDEEHLNVSGCKGYYVWKLDAKNLTIILAATEEEAQNTEDVPAPFTIGYAVDDKISLNCNYEYVDCSTITEIIDNAFRVDSLPPYYLENDATNYSKWSDKDTLFVNNTIYCTDKPNVGLADVGIGSHSEGVSNKSIGYGAHAEGSRNIAKGANSHTEGAENSAEYCSHAEGGGNKALGLYSHAEGHKTTASGNTAHAEGNETKASGSASHAEGEESTASGSCSHAEGDETTASGNASHAEGDQTIANGMASHVEGCSAKALGWASHAEGKESTASGDYTHAEGSNTTASKSASHAEGDQTIANGVASHAEGHYAKALGWASHAEGLGTIAKETAQHVEGKYNADEPTALHIVGCGTSDTERDNCFSTGVTTDGQKYIKVGDTMITEAQLIKLLALLG